MNTDPETDVDVQLQNYTSTSQLSSEHPQLLSGHEGFVLK